MRKFDGLLSLLVFCQKKNKLFFKGSFAVILYILVLPETLFLLWNLLRSEGPKDLQMQSVCVSSREQQYVCVLFLLSFFYSIISY